MAAKSKRSVNWSENEKKYLLGLIEAKIDIIECKRVDPKDYPGVLPWPSLFYTGFLNGKCCSHNPSLGRCHDK